MIMKTKKIFTMLSLMVGLFLSGFALSACGGDDDDNNNSSPNPIVGTWYVEKETSKGELKYTEMTFEKDMTFTWREYLKDSNGDLTLNNSDSGTYYTAEGVLYTTWKKYSSKPRNYTISGNKMTTDEAGGTTWTRK